MRVLINGLPLFSERLAKDLKRHDPTSTFLFLDTYNSRWAQFKFMLLLPFADLVISLNGVTDNSGSLNAVLKLKKKLVLQWMGTDALLAMDRFENGTIKRDYIDYASNFVDSSWLKDEVESVGVKTEFLYFKSTEVVPAISKYNGLSAISYIAQNRQEFYGIKRVVSLAHQFPEIPFYIYGMDQAEIEIPSNIILKGWVPVHEFQAALRESPIFLRLTDHDGFPVSVIEALGFGAEVLMSLPSELTYLASTEKEAIHTMHQAIEKVKMSDFTPNFDTIEHVKVNYNRNQLMEIYLLKLKSILENN